jgi:hypothetical protein
LNSDALIFAFIFIIFAAELVDLVYPWSACAAFASHHSGAGDVRSLDLLLAIGDSSFMCVKCASASDLSLSVTGGLKSKNNPLAMLLGVRGDIGGVLMRLASCYHIKSASTWPLMARIFSRLRFDLRDSESWKGRVVLTDGRKVGS